jgi:hypothetical protein
MFDEILLPHDHVKECGIYNKSLSIAVMMTNESKQ